GWSRRQLRDGAACAAESALRPRGRHALPVRRSARCAGAAGSCSERRRCGQDPGRAWRHRAVAGNQVMPMASAFPLVLAALLAQGRVDRLASQGVTRIGGMAMKRSRIAYGLALLSGGLLLTGLSTGLWAAT